MFILSDIGYLAAARIQDDSFYYLQPAWMFKETGQFTFDGETPTYGFQPLWMVLLTMLSYLTLDKITFVRAALVLGALFYCATGFLLYGLSRRWAEGWRALIAPILWLINPPLIAIYTTGKENALFAFLLIASLLFTYRLLHQRYRPWTYVLYGGLCGLLILSRINGVIAVALLIPAAAVFSSTHSTRRERLWQLTLISCGLGVILLPWLVYSASTLGSLLPNSGARKLIGAKAALALYLNGTIPPLRLDWLASFLSPEERLFLQTPDQLVLPSASLITEFLMRYIPNVSIGFWRNMLVVGLPESRRDFVLLPYTLIIVTGLLTSFAYGWILQTKALLSNPTRFVTTLRSHMPLVILFLFAFVNALMNGLLLPGYLYWGSWYAVPETLTCVLAASCAGVLAFNTLLNAHFWQRRGSAIGNWLPMRRMIPAIGMMVGLLLLGPPIYSLYRQTSPRSFVSTAEYQHEAWEAHLWINQHIPAGTKIGSWSSGILGYFADGPVVVNLDGLANSPAYVDTVYLNYALFYRGLTQRNELWAYIQAKRIEYIADADFEVNLGKKPFFRVIPVENYRIVYQGSHLLDWGEQEGPRRFVIIRLRY